MLSRETGLSLKILRRLSARRSDWTPLSRLARDLDLSRPYASKLCQRLRLAGYLEARQGVNGGFRLDRSRRKATYYDLIADLGDPFMTATCLTLRAPCTGDTPCAMHETWQRLRRELVEALKVCSIVEGTS